MRILKTIYLEDVENIPSEVKEYQRPIEKTRLSKIVKSIREHGYFPQAVLVLNQENQCVDGQHRLQAAKDCEIQKVPCVKWHFNGIVEETEMFTHLNSFNTMLKSVYIWHSRKIWGCPIAKMVYKLHEDPNSPFHGMIRVKGNDSIATEKKKLTIVSLIQLMNTLCFNLRAPHYNYSGVNNTMENNFSNLDYDEALARGYEFMNWFRIFADRNNAWYGQRFIPAISIVFKSLKEQGYFTNANRNRRVASHLISMSVAKPFPSEHRSTKIMMMKAHIVGRYTSFRDWNPFLATSR